jgi:hypothetical protein
MTKFFQVLPSILSKYQFHFDQLWANISSILTNVDQRLNYWVCVTAPTPPYSDVPEPNVTIKAIYQIYHADCIL